MSSAPRVLIADDEARYRTTLSKMLSAQGLAVTAVASGEEALEVLRREPFEVVLLDLRMPGMGGIAALEEIKKIDARVEVIVLSGHASVDTAVKIMERGAYDYLLKPCPVEDVLLKIDGAMEKIATRDKISRKSAPEGGGKGGAG